MNITSYSLQLPVAGHAPFSLWVPVSGITSRYKFHTSGHPNFAIPIFELLYAASFAQTLDRNVLFI